MFFSSKYLAHAKNLQIAPDFMSQTSHLLFGVVMETTLIGKYQSDSCVGR